MLDSTTPSAPASDGGRTVVLAIVASFDAVGVEICVVFVRSVALSMSTELVALLLPACDEIDMVDVDVDDTTMLLMLVVDDDGKRAKRF